MQRASSKPVAPRIVGLRPAYVPQELQSESLPLLLGKDTVDRAIMARLLDAPDQYPQWPLHYLIGCYGRATAEARSLSSLKNKDAASSIQQDLQYCKELIAANAGLLLTMSDSLFPQVCLPATACMCCCFLTTGPGVGTLHQDHARSNLMTRGSNVPDTSAAMTIITLDVHKHCTACSRQMCMVCHSHTAHHTFFCTDSSRFCSLWAFLTCSQSKLELKDLFSFLTA